MRKMGKSEEGLVAKNIFFIGPHFSESAPSTSGLALEGPFAGYFSIGNNMKNILTYMTYDRRRDHPEYVRRR